jgi:hypothetical protein
LRGGVGGGGPRALNVVEHAFNISQDVIVPEAQNTISGCFDNPSASKVFVSLPFVLAAIDLDHQLGFATDEISDEWSDLGLTAKVRAGQPDIVTKTLPEDALGRSRLGAHPACK